MRSARFKIVRVVQSAEPSLGWHVTLACGHSYRIMRKNSPTIGFHLACRRGCHCPSDTPKLVSAVKGASR